MELDREASMTSLVGNVSEILSVTSPGMVTPTPQPSASMQDDVDFVKALRGDDQQQYREMATPSARGLQSVSSMPVTRSPIAARQQELAGSTYNSYGATLNESATTPLMRSSSATNPSASPQSALSNPILRSNVNFAGSTESPGGANLHRYTSNISPVSMAIDMTNVSQPVATPRENAGSTPVSGAYNAGQTPTTPQRDGKGV